MNTGKYIFGQVTDFLSANDFIKCVGKFKGNYQIKHFSCWNQLMCMLFGQLSNRESLFRMLVIIHHSSPSLTIELLRKFFLIKHGMPIAF
jgi:hypothetical protein